LLLEKYKNILNFLKKEHIATISVSKNNIPYSFNCFYLYDEEDNLLIFASNIDTYHMKIIKKNSIASGAIFLNTKNISKIEGVQFQGEIIELKKEKKIKYLKKFPISLTLKPKILGIKIKYIKYTNNNLGFGKKIEIGKKIS